MDSITQATGNSGTFDLQTWKGVPRLPDAGGQGFPYGLQTFIKRLISNLLIGLFFNPKNINNDNICLRPKKQNQ